MLVPIAQVNSFDTMLRTLLVTVAIAQCTAFSVLPPQVLSWSSIKARNLDSHVNPFSNLNSDLVVHAVSSQDETNEYPQVLKSTLLGMLVAVSLTLCCSSPALAATDPSVSVTVFNQVYDDPLHPLCLRKIKVNQDGKTFHYSGTAVGPKEDSVLRGCSYQEQKEFGLRRGAFDGEVLPGLKISAGDGIHEGVWEPANSVTTTYSDYKDVDGIRWNDGNKWVVKKSPLANLVGEGFFLAYIGVSLLAGGKWVVDQIQKRQAEA
jgi:hypothetical protein